MHKSFCQLHAYDSKIIGGNMKENIINMAEMASQLKVKHQIFIKKYGVMAEKKISDRSLQRDQLYSKLVLVAKAFERAGVCSSHQEIEIRSIKDCYSRSIAIQTVAGTAVYLLNGCDYLVVTDGVVSEDPFSRTLVLLSSAKHSSFMKSYEDVMKDGFDWNSFAIEVLDAVHKIAYYSTEVTHKYFESSGETLDD